MSRRQIVLFISSTSSRSLLPLVFFLSFVFQYALNLLSLMITRSAVDLSTVHVTYIKRDLVLLIDDKTDESTLHYKNREGWIHTFYTRE